MHRFLKENGLSLSFFALYFGSAIGDAWTGMHAFNSLRATHGLSAYRLSAFLSSGTFLDGIATNWQAAVLQLYVLIVFTSILYQRGATHSRKLSGQRKVRRKSGWLHRNSLSLAFLALFVVSFTAHIVFGRRAENEQRALDGFSQVTVSSFFRSSQFWTSTLSCWQAEFFALFAYIVLSISLRQANSPESKPEDAQDASTGDANK